MKLNANLSSLTSDQKSAFARINALLGLGPTECTYHIQDGAQPTRLVLSSNPEKSHVPPHFVPIGSIAELRKVAGYDDILPKTAERPEDEAYYPSPLTPDEKNLLSSQAKAMKPTVSKEMKERIDMAAIAYVMLNPARVEEFVPLINAYMFPGKVAVFVAEDLNVPPGGTVVLSGDGPTIFNYAAVTVGAGGTIQVDVNCTFNCQTFTQL